MTGTVWAVVPVKPLLEAKSRLAPALNEEERAALVLRLLAHTLEVLAEVPGLARVVVLSADARVGTMAQERGAEHLAERGAPGLNPSLERAARLFEGAGVEGMLIVHGDLPLLTAESVGVVLEGAAPPPSVVIAPDHSGRGTNVLLMTPPRLFPFCFGPNSFRRHLAQAKRHGASIAVVRRAELAADVDTPGDLSFLGPRGKNERPS